MGVLLTKVKSGIRPTDVEIYNGSNTYVNQGIDPLDDKHDEKGPNSLWKEKEEQVSSWLKHALSKPQDKGLKWRNSLVLQWLGLHASTAGNQGLLPGLGTKILQATWCGPLKKQTKTLDKTRAFRNNGPLINL